MGMVWFCKVRYGMVWYGMVRVWYGMVWYGKGMVWYGMWYGMVCGMVCGMVRVWYGMVWYMVWYGMVCGMVWYGTGMVWYGMWYGRIKVLTISPSTGVMINPIRRATLHRLNPLFRITVGKSSEVKTKITQQHPTKAMRLIKAIMFCPIISAGLLPGIHPAMKERIPPMRK
jgi:hypothetical protein